MNRTTCTGKLYHPHVKFGNDFCNRLFARQCKAEELKAFGPGKYIYPIFEILN